MPRVWCHAKAMHEDPFSISDGEEDTAIFEVPHQHYSSIVLLVTRIDAVKRSASWICMSRAEQMAWESCCLWWRQMDCPIIHVPQSVRSICSLILFLLVQRNMPSRGCEKDTRGEDDRRLCNPVQRNEGRCIRVAWYLSFDKQPWPWRALVNFVPMYMFVCSWYLVRDHEMKAIHCSFWAYTSWIPSEPYSLSFSIHHTLWISFVLCLYASISWLLLHIFLLSLSHHQGSRISLMTTGTRCEPGISSRR